MKVNEIEKTQMESSGLDARMGHTSQGEEVEDKIIGK